MRLTEAVTAAVADPADPAAVLALAYAERIDENIHVRLPIDNALRTLHEACTALDNPEAALAALTKVTAALSAVTVLGDLGPKLLTTLDALTLTPKAKAAITGGLDNAGRPASPLDALRERHDNRRLRAAG